MDEKVFSSADELRQHRIKSGAAKYLSGIPSGGYVIQHKVEYVKADHDGNYRNSDYLIVPAEEAEVYTNTWASYKLKELPGCCGVMVSYNAFVFSDYEGNGLGDYFHKERLKLAKEMGYSTVMCTVTAENAKQINLLTKNGWKMVHNFINRRTKNVVQMWVKDIV